MVGPKTIAGCCLLLLLVLESGLAQDRPLAYPIPDTGQDRCYEESGPVNDPLSGKPYFGQDGQIEGNKPSYKDNGDGSVTDLVTGLVWQKTPDFKMRTWEDGGQYASGLRLAGKTDWRLPSIKELFSLADFRGNMHTRTPYIDTRFFDFRYPDSSAGVRDMDGQYWSSTQYAGTTMAGDTSVFGFNFADGRIKAYPVKFGRGNRPGVKKYVRCVRGRPYGKNDFKDNSDGSVTDRATGLTWMKIPAKKTMNWKEALRFAETLEACGHSDWRLPNVKELQSLVNYSRAPDATRASARGLAIDPVFKVVGDGGWFWSSTTHIENQGAYYVAFGPATSMRMYNGRRMNAHGAGAVRSDPKSGDPARWPQGLGPQGDEIRILNYVRCVRGGTARLRSPTKTGKAGFSVVTVGTGSPRYNPDRSGPSALVRLGEKLILVDMGNGTQARLNEAGISLGDLDALLFTHHHLDHNEELTPILIRTRLKGAGGVIMGTPGTKERVDFVLEIFKEDLAYRAAKTGRTVEDLGRPKVRELSGGEEFALFSAKVRTAKVVHTLHTVAYRFDLSGKSIVISGDTSFSENLIELAKGADVLVMDSGGVVYRSGKGKKKGKQGGRMQGAGGRGKGKKKDKAHATLEEVGEMAARAGVKRLVLTHFGPGEVDEEETRKGLSEMYKGEIIFGRDLLEIVPGGKMGEVKAEKGQGKKRGSSSSQLPRFIRRLDKDGDGKVSKAEFDGPPRAFGRHDRNGDGFLDETEVPERRR